MDPAEQVAKGGGERRRPGRWRRRLIRGGAALLGFAILAGALLPWWLGMALAAVLPIRGFDFARYERIGYARFALHDVTIQRPGVLVRISRAETDTPLLWAWKKSRGEAPLVSGGDWSVEVTRRSTAPRADAGWVSLKGRLQNIARRLDSWLPDASAGSGRVTWPGGGLAMGAATWGQALLQVSNLQLFGLAGDVSVRFAPDTGEFTAEATNQPDAWSLALQSQGPALDGSLRWRGQVAPLTAEFAPAGWIPRAADWRALDWELPGEALRLGAGFSTVRGRAIVGWGADRLTAEMVVQGQPRPDVQAPPLNVALSGQGDWQSFRVEQLTVRMPGIDAVLDAPVTVDRSGRVRGTNARFALRADLAQQPWFAARGLVEGYLQLDSQPRPETPVNFELTANQLSVRGFDFASAQVAGRIEWPRILVSRARLVPTEGERIEAEGGWDQATRSLLPSRATADLKRSTLERWLPSEVAFERVAGEARFSGPLAELRHEGSASVESIRYRFLKPVAVKAAWSGRGTEIERIEAAAAFGDTTLEAVGTLGPAGVALRNFAWSSRGERLGELSAPAEIGFGAQPAVRNWRLRTPQGGFLSADMRLGPAGAIDLRASGIGSSWFEDLVDLPGPAWNVADLTVSTQWDRGPVTGLVRLGATAHINDRQDVVVNLAARSDPTGWTLESLNAGEAGVPILDATGRLGVAVRLDSPPLLRLEPEAPLELQLQAAPNAAFWARLQEVTGLGLVNPDVAVRLTGTWGRPQGQVNLRASRVEYANATTRLRLPRLESLELVASGDSTGLLLSNFSVQAEAQPVSARGRLPLTAAEWPDLWRNPLRILRQKAEARLEFPTANLSALAGLYPEFVAPQGTVSAWVELRPGGMWNGRLELRRAATRPLGPIGALQEIDAAVVLMEQGVEIETARARIGGQPVTLTGSARFPPDAPARYDLALQAANLPFVRQSGLLMRGDLDLTLQSQGQEVPLLSGRVTLRRSLFLQDVRAFLTTGPRGVQRRPPYFAIEAERFRDWRLAVEVQGDRFLRLRTALFNGVASVDFSLAGTLGTPWATGEARIDEGQILLPFANFDVTGGQVSLTAANPFEPQLWIAGTARRYGYDLRLDLTGAASAPRIEFTSSPPLSSEEVLLLVMAGTVPREESAGELGSRRFARIGTYLGQSLLNNLGGDPENADRLTLSTGDKLSRLGRETYNIQYELNDRWALQGEYDEYDSFNAGIRWRVFSRGGSADAGK